MSAPTRTVGPYEVVRELGRGGMGAVYEVRHPEIGRRLALKQILDCADAEALQRFGREAQLLAKLSHPGVVTVHQLGRTEAGPYLVTELVEGEELNAVCDTRGPMDPRRAAEVIRDVADALVAVHAQGVLHRDLKPHNVILRPDGSPVLLDFGLAVGDESERLTQTGVAVGTPCYMPPEQAEGAGASVELDARADVYGLGATLYHLLAGHAPFHDAGGAIQIISKILRQEPTWPSAEVERVPPDLEAICRRAMAKQPGDRYPTAEALRDDLDRFLRGEATEAGPRRRSRLGLALALSATLLLGLAVVLATRDLGRHSEGSAATAPVETETTARSSANRAKVREGRTALQAFQAKYPSDPLGYAEAASKWLEAYPEHPSSAGVRRDYEDARAHFPYKLADLPHPTATTETVQWRAAAFWGETHALTLTGQAPVLLWDLHDPQNPTVERTIDVRELLEVGESFPYARGVAVDATHDCCYLVFQVKAPNIAVVRITGRAGAIEPLDLARPTDVTPSANTLVLSPDGSSLLMSFFGPLEAGARSYSLWSIPVASNGLMNLPALVSGGLQAGVYSLAFSPGGALALSSGLHGEAITRGVNLVRVLPDWKNAPQRVHEISFRGVPQTLAFAGDEVLLVGTNQHRIYALPMDALPREEPRVGDREFSFVAGDAALLGVPTAHNGEIAGVAAFAGGTRVVSCSGERHEPVDAPEKSEVRVWDRGTRTQLCSRLRLRPGRDRLTLSPSARLMIVSVRANRHELWALDPP